MKKMLLGLVLVLFCCSSTMGAFAAPILCDGDTFITRFILGSTMLGETIDLGKPTVKREDGTATLQYDVSEHVSLLLFADPDAEDIQIESVMMLGAGNGKADSGLAILQALASTLYACGGVEEISGVGALLENLGMLEEDAFSDGSSNEQTINGIDYSWAVSSDVGFLITISPEE